MTRICMAGAMGRMGRRILERAAAADDITIAGAFDLPEHDGKTLTVGAESGRSVTVAVSGDAKEALSGADVLIDFTLAEACLPNARMAADLGKAVVIGTTGLAPSDKAELAALARSVPVVFAPNMSVGVNLLFKITAEVARVLGLDYNVEITEIHHNQKKDSPSGTAARLAECAAEGLGLAYPADAVHGREGMVGARPAREIGMHALRGGDVTGIHTVHFIGHGETVELTHRAHSRDTFAEGALRAARFTATAKAGLYDMQDVLGLR
jgi:4-hydroxy-tetrahydrodipicolinate reductase